MTTKVPIIPAFRYHNAPAAIEFLVNAFGFEKHAVYQDDSGEIGHAELTIGKDQGMIMLSSSRDDEWGAHVKPAQTVGTNTCSIYVIVSDVDEHCKRAKAAGAEIITEPADQDYGGRGYGCKDLEGHLWYFGSYDPFA